MNWRLKLVLLFTKLQKPIEIGEVVDIKELRRKSDFAGRLGTRILDRPVEVLKTTDTTAETVPVRIYQNSTERSQRVIIYYHGGGFVLYDLNSHDNVCRRLCRMNNCIVVAVDYRLAPEHTYPAAHDDAFTAIKWVMKNIENYGGNPEEIILAGDSAGGNLSACMAHRCKAQGIKLKGQVLIYPWIDGKLNNPSITRNGKGYLLVKDTMFWFQQVYTPDKADQLKPALCPCYQTDFKDLAPAFILTAQFDPLLDDGFNYYNQLKAAGNKVMYKEYPNLVHGFFNIPRVDPVAKQAYYDIADFIKSL
ncbi:MAG: hypothetical protein JWO06_815 [Bacteroidota bacterium]|nr:hypothetical protein [Bacteroidota bacterium]